MLERNMFFKGVLGASLIVGVGAAGSTAAVAAECVDTDGDGWGYGEGDGADGDGADGDGADGDGADGDGADGDGADGDGADGDGADGDGADHDGAIVDQTADAGEGQHDTVNAAEPGELVVIPVNAPVQAERSDRDTVTEDQEPEQSSTGLDEQLVVTPANAQAGGECVDTDGDGWGWDGSASCRMVVECIDTDGDGWGWDGSASCRVGLPASYTEEYFADHNLPLYVPPPIESGDRETHTRDLEDIGERSEFEQISSAVIENIAGPEIRPRIPSRWSPNCELVESDWRLHVDGSEGPCEYSPGGDGSGVTVYVLDGELDASHVALQESTIRSSVDFISPRAAYGSDCGPGHATQVTSLLASEDAGIAPGVTVAPIEVTFCTSETDSGKDEEAGYLNDLTNGLQYVLDNHDSGPTIVNLSLSLPAGTAGATAVDTLVNDLHKDGVLVVSAAGNGSGACNASPSRSDSTLTVGALVQPNQTHASYNKGACVDVYAPSEVRAANDETGGYMSSSGTSMATPVVAGIAAVYWSQNPHLSVDQVMDDIKANAQRFDEAGTDCGGACLAAQIVPANFRTATRVA